MIGTDKLNRLRDKSRD